MMLDRDSQTTLDGRAQVGRIAMNVAWGRTPIHPDDLEFAARDVISDVLTAVLGPAGSVSVDAEIEYDEDTISRAHNLLYRALESYRGDAEDYTRED
jgi:hypothetical protein